MERHYRKIGMVSNLIDEICPRIRKKLAQNMEDSWNYFTKPAIGNKFQVSDGEDSLVFDLNGRTCSCNAWELSKIPSNHSISAIGFMKLDPMLFVNE